MRGELARYVNALLVGGEGEEGVAVAAEEGDAAEGDDESDDAIGDEGGVVVEFVDEGGGGDDLEGGEYGDELDQARLREALDDPGTKRGAPNDDGDGSEPQPKEVEARGVDGTEGTSVEGDDLVSCEADVELAVEEGEGDEADDGDGGHDEDAGGDTAAGMQSGEDDAEEKDEDVDAGAGEGGDGAAQEGSEHQAGQDASIPVGESLLAHVGLAQHEEHGERHGGEEDGEGRFDEGGREGGGPEGLVGFSEQEERGEEARQAHRDTDGDRARFDVAATDEDDDRGNGEADRLNREGEGASDLGDDVERFGEDGEGNGPRAGGGRARQERAEDHGEGGFPAVDGAVELSQGEDGAEPDDGDRCGDRDDGNLTRGQGSNAAGETLGDTFGQAPRGGGRLHSLSVPLAAGRWPVVERTVYSVERVLISGCGT